MRAEPTNNREAGIDTNHSTMLTLLLELNAICEQRWIQFELQNSPSRVSAFHGEIPVMESRDLVSVARRVSRPVFLSLGLGLGLERLRSRLGLGLERFRSRSRVLGLEVLGLK